MTTEVSEEMPVSHHEKLQTKHYAQNSTAFGFSFFQMIMVAAALGVTAAVSFVGGIVVIVFVLIVLIFLVLVVVLVPVVPVVPVVVCHLLRSRDESAD